MKVEIFLTYEQCGLCIFFLMLGKHFSLFTILYTCQGFSSLKILHKVIYIGDWIQSVPGSFYLRSSWGATQPGEKLGCFVTVPVQLSQGVLAFDHLTLYCVSSS